MDLSPVESKGSLLLCDGDMVIDEYYASVLESRVPPVVMSAHLGSIRDGDVF